MSNSNRTVFLFSLLFVFIYSCSTKEELPNIVIVFADDLGYGDVSCLNEKSKIQTPFMDQVAKEGITFTDAHTSSAVCTPSRYGLLTGRYAWRTRLKGSVLWGYSRPLIETDRLTLASMLKQSGYNTACIGKWHLGLDWPLKEGVSPIRGKKEETYGGDKIDFTRPVKNGPTALGFDYFFGISASLDMPPYTFIENDRVLEVPSIKRGDGFGRKGFANENLEPEDYLLKISEKATETIRDYAKKDAPFFMYLPLPSPHTPLAVAERFKNSTEIGAYGDYVVETDWVVGQVMNALEESGVDKNTLLIVTSDNGPEFLMVKRKEEYNHYSAADFRGCKRDNWEGGHRVPFFAKWPKKINPGTSSDQVLCLTDLMNTLAAIADVNVSENTGEDSYDMLPALIDAVGEEQIREATIHHSSQGKFAIRKGKWVLLLHPGSGGNDRKYIPSEPEIMDEPISLYDLQKDPEQTDNVYKDHPGIVEELTKLARAYINNGRSTPGAPQENDPVHGEWKQIKSIMN